MFDDSIPCRPWSGAATGKHRRGYTRRGPHGAETYTYVYRAEYERVLGPIPEGYVVDHLCQNPNCWEPTHLEAVARGENTRRYFARLTHCSHGHEYTAENTYLRKGTEQRICRTCHRNTERVRREARRGSQA